MQKFIQKLFLNSLVFVSIILFTSQFDNNKFISTNNFNAHKLNSARNTDSLDILLLGNSYCYSSFNSPLLDSNGYKTFNLGVATAGPKFTNMIIEDYMKNVRDVPRRVAIIMDPMFFSNMADNYSNFPLHRFLSKPISNIEMKMRYWTDFNLIESYRTSLRFALNGFYQSTVKNDVAKKAILEKNKGFMPSDKTVSSKDHQKNNQLYSNLKESKINCETLLSFKRMLRKIEERGSIVILIKLPQTELYDYYSPKYIEKYNSFEAELYSKYLHLEVPEKLFDSTHYRNIDHMNTRGAEISTKILLEYLHRNAIN